MELEDLEDDFREAYPNLSRELAESEGLDIEGVRTSGGVDEGSTRMPTAVDHLQRCQTPEEAVEVIEFLAETGEIEEGYGKDLKRQLVSRGLRSFGPKREPGEIERDGL